MTLKKSFLILSFMISSMVMYAQPTGLPDGNNDPGGNDPGGGVPVDGGLVFLLAAGAGYGAKKAYDYRKNKVKSEK